MFIYLIRDFLEISNLIFILFSVQIFNKNLLIFYYVPSTHAFNNIFNPIKGVKQDDLQKKKESYFELKNNYKETLNEEVINFNETFIKLKKRSRYIKGPNMLGHFFNKLKEKNRNEHRKRKLDNTKTVLTHNTIFWYNSYFLKKFNLGLKRSKNNDLLTKIKRKRLRIRTLLEYKKTQVFNFFEERFIFKSLWGLSWKKRISEKESKLIKKKREFRVTKKHKLKFNLFVWKQYRRFKFRSTRRKSNLHCLFKSIKASIKHWYFNISMFIKNVKISLFSSLAIDWKDFEDLIIFLRSSINNKVIEIIIKFRKIIIFNLDYNFYYYKEKYVIDNSGFKKGLRRMRGFFRLRKKRSPRSFFLDYFWILSSFLALPVYWSTRYLYRFKELILSCILTIPLILFFYYFFFALGFSYSFWLSYLISFWCIFLMKK